MPDERKGKSRDADKIVELIKSGATNEDKVFIITNIPSDQQYMNIDRETRQAFFRRIHVVREYEASGRIAEYAGVQAYIDRFKWAEACVGQPVQMTF